MILNFNPRDDFIYKFVETSNPVKDKLGVWIYLTGQKNDYQFQLVSKDVQKDRWT